MGSEGGLPMSGEMDKEAIGGLIGTVKEAIPGGMKLTPTGWTAEGDQIALEMEPYGEMSNGKEEFEALIKFMLIWSKCLMPLPNLST
ncbi:MAG: hypothetical protein F6K36_20130 [Symploca sp. SIO3C6]|nr:hypothetical protein [Symploca sp. SIO3C6]